MSKLDELFQRKLADHSLLPSPGVWENVEARLSKKNETLIRMRWAAVFLFGGLLFSLLWVRNRETSLPVAIEKSVIPSMPEIESKLKVAPQVAENKKTTIHGRQQKKKGIHHQIPLTVPVIKDGTNGNVEIDETPLPVAEVKPTKGTEIKQVDPRPIVLTYTLDAVAATEVEDTGEKVAASAEKKDKSFKRMMKIAGEVKNSESPLGGIRNMKEDLFALDLKNKNTTKKH